jgi:uncharacterized membrane protein YedE/YeeE
MRGDKEGTGRPGAENAAILIPDFECQDIQQVPPAQREEALEAGNHPIALLGYLVIGIGLGIIFVQSEVVSWFRIQEMFRFQSFHMYGIIGSAVAVAATSIQIIQRLGLKTMHGEVVRIVSRDDGGKGFRGPRYWMGGTLFGMGWALLGACPGPIFTLIGSGITVMLAALLSAMAGTWVYGAVQHFLPH